MAVEKNKIMSAQDIDRALTRIALQMMEQNSDSAELGIIGIHTGGVHLADRIHKIIQSRENIDLPVGSLDITLYRDDWSLASQNPMVKKTDLAFSVEGKTIVLIDDVIFTGRTIRAAMDAIMDFGRPRAIQLAVLVDRNGRELPIQADYVGTNVTVRPDEHIHVRLKETNGTDEIVRTSFK